MSTSRDGTQAIALLNTESGSEPQVLKEVKQIEHVTEAHILYGLYDIYVRVEAEFPEVAKETVSSRIRQLKHVKSTLTMIISG